MPKIGNQVNHSDLPCDRCNSKRKVAKVWTETIKTEYSTMVLRHSKIICTNKECQMAFEKLILEESLKREKRKQDKTETNTKKSTNKIIRSLN